MDGAAPIVVTQAGQVLDDLFVLAQERLVAVQGVLGREQPFQPTLPDGVQRGTWPSGPGASAKTLSFGRPSWVLALL